MAVGTYGSVKLADVDFNDVDVLYSYSPDRESLGDVEFQPIYNSFIPTHYLEWVSGKGCNHGSPIPLISGGSYSIMYNLF